MGHKHGILEVAGRLVFAFMAYIEYGGTVRKRTGELRPQTSLAVPGDQG